MRLGLGGFGEALRRIIISLKNVYLLEIVMVTYIIKQERERFTDAKCFYSLCE